MTVGSLNRLAIRFLPFGALPSDPPQKAVPKSPSTQESYTYPKPVPQLLVPKPQVPNIGHMDL